MQQLGAVVERGSQPWSNPPSRLTAEAIVGGDRLEDEIKQINHQTEQLVDVAMTTVQAVETERHHHRGDDTMIHVQRVKVTASHIAKLAPVMISTAREASSSRSSRESLNIISQEWATNAKLLLHSVDAITDPPNSAVNYLVTSVESGDPQLLDDQVTHIQMLTATLQEVAHNALSGCSDPEVARGVAETVQKIDRLSGQLVSCARAVTTATGTSEHDSAAEQFTIMKHSWNSNVQLLTSQVDDLVGRMAAPLSKLVTTAVAISKTEAPATKQYLLNQFTQSADGLTAHVSTLEQWFGETVSVAHGDESIEAAGASIESIKKLTPCVIAAVRSLAEEQGSSVVEHFQSLKRQWAARMQLLHVQLMNITSVDMSPVLVAFEEMVRPAATNGVALPLPRPQSSASVRDSPRMRPSSQVGVVRRKPHAFSERPITIAVPQQAAPSFSSITTAAWNLHREADQFVEEGNPIISTAKDMSELMRQLAEYTKGRGNIETKEEMIATAKEIAQQAKVVVSYASKIAQQCTDMRMKQSLLQSAELIPTLGTQLTIISSVKASTPDDISADIMLVKNAQNLMQAVIKTIREAEAACMKGLDPSDNPDESEAVTLALNWKKNLYHRRNMESVRAPLTQKGLRRLDKAASTSSLVDVIKRERSLGSPPKR